MNRDEPRFEKKLQKFSIVQKCPRCKHLTLGYKDGSICCSDCGYEEKVPTVR